MRTCATIAITTPPTVLWTHIEPFTSLTLAVATGRATIALTRGRAIEILIGLTDIIATLKFVTVGRTVEGVFTFVTEVIAAG